MWPSNFQDRLRQWADLKDQCINTSNPEAVLFTINAWWFQTPWTAYYLHWDDRDNWPDPWQLLSDNIYCSLARGLGIMYTIAMIDHPGIQDAVLTDNEDDNLVQVSQGKYILNWDPELVLNTSPIIQRDIKHSLNQKIIKQQLI